MIYEQDAEHALWLNIKAAILEHSGGQCECRRERHRHTYERCTSVIDRRAMHLVLQDSLGNDHDLTNLWGVCADCYRRDKPKERVR
jgi:hypothetical protein